jgi:hypothetical protein
MSPISIVQSEPQQQTQTQPEKPTSNEPKGEFTYCPLSGNVTDKCCISMDTGRPAVHSDQLAADQCCAEVQCLVCVIPFFIIDIIAFPFRGLKHLCSK